jgi:hypothetical protein
VTKTLGQRPADHKLSAAELVALHATPDRHPNALSHEMAVTTEAALVTLAYGEYAPGQPHQDVPADLAEAAYDELERRQAAKARLLADCPALAAALTRRV